MGKRVTRRGRSGPCLGAIRTSCVGYFTDQSLLRQVVGHRLTGLSGPRALLVMAAHPVAFQGFCAPGGAPDPPHARLKRTATVMDAVAFGSKRKADKLT